MSEKTTIARPYAQAVFELASEGGNSSEWSDAIALLSKIVADEQMQGLLNNPKVSNEQLFDIVTSIGGQGLSAQSQNLVRVLIDANRLEYAPQISELFEALRAEAEGTVDVEVSSAYELDQGQQDKIAEAIAARLGKKVKISATVDSSLIGGAIIRANDAVIDASIRGRLTELASDLV